MRQVKRIPVIIDVLQDNDKKREVLEHFFKPKPGTQMEIGMPFYEIDNFIEIWDKNYYETAIFWKQNPDLRLAQVLVNGIVPNYPGFWFHIEDEQLMLDTGLLEARDILFWGQNYDKEMNRLPETNWILIKDMGTDHIRAILFDIIEGRMDVNNSYREAFVNEIKIRKDGSKEVSL